MAHRRATLQAFRNCDPEEEGHPHVPKSKNSPYIQSQGQGFNLKGAILDQIMPKSMDFNGFQWISMNVNRFSLILNGFRWI